MLPLSNSPGPMSPLSTTPSSDLPVDPGPPPETVQEYDDIYVEDVLPDSPVGPEEKVYDRKGKGKARQRSLSRTPRSALLKQDPDVLDAMAEQAYLSPPLTSSDSFLLGVHNISLALRKGLSSIDFEVDLDLQSGSERSSSPGGRSLSSTASDEGEGEPEAGRVHVATALSELSSEDAAESSILTPSATSEAESSRRATVGDSTIQDAGSILPAVRFPSIFTQDMDYSSLESSRTASPLAVSDAKGPDGLERPMRLGEDPIAKKPGVGILVHRSKNIVGVGVRSKRRRRVWRQRRFKIQEKGLTRDFLLVITLCFGMACAGILIVRPTLMALYGYGSLGGRLDQDFD